ncbi:GHKL domain-containing protein [Tuanshanicoccus lijuaniae]|uniref:GHKL domain-containing protein n=1 Tax=Aerococcaceae bacterium zg-1292 TaxID=2774330 RepID=UPI001BD87F62|nr:GHKL domain-containing protein [Aerococcaceae bacterium zg-A91]MBS4457295.1 GHKL domain-containing protein [Aerococcaceae bacterium zg-BR33]
MITNTPGVFYAISYWVSCCIILSVSPRRHHARVTVTVLSLFFITLLIIMMLSDGVVQLFLPLMILYIVLIFAVMWCLGQFDVKNALYFAIRVFIMGEFIASLGWQILFYLGITQQLWLSYFCYFGVFVPMMTVLFWWLESRLKQFNAVIAVTYHEVMAVIIIGAAIFIMSNLSYALGDSLFSSRFTYEIFLVRTLFDLAGVAILYAYHYQLAQLQTRLEYERLQQMLHMQYQNYEVLEQSIEMINQKYHDLKYQINLLKSEAGNQKHVDYLSNMEKDIKLYEAKNQTGNKILDTILTGKAIFCQRNEIELMVVADGSLLSFMTPYDLSTLFGNMLDNAIESVQKIDDIEKRLIHLLIMQEKGFVRIRMENCYEGPMELDGDWPKTTKFDSHSHGYGLKSIREIVTRYRGSVTFEARNGWFELRILLPLNG